MRIPIYSFVTQDLETYKGCNNAPGYKVMKVYRFGQWRYGIKISIFRKLMSFIYKMQHQRVILKTGIELPCEAVVGENFRIDHQNGIVISGYARFGHHCVIRNGVTVGLKNVGEPKAPRIGNYVDIGAGAKILGDITIGDHVNIGANAVVINDIPSYSLAVGIPARIIPLKREENEHS